MTNKVSDVHTYYPHVYLYPTLLFASVIDAGLRLLVLWTVRLCLLIRENQISTWYIQLLTMIDGDHIISSILFFHILWRGSIPRDKRQAFYGKEQKVHWTGRRRHTCVLQRFFRPWNGDLKLNCPRNSISSWYVLRGIPEPDWAVKHMCASFFLSSVPSVPSHKMPASCLVRVFHLPHYCDKQQYKAELLHK